VVINPGWKHIIESKFTEISRLDMIGPVLKSAVGIITIRLRSGL